MLAQVAGVIEPDGLQIRLFSFDRGEGGLGENLRGDVLNRRTGDSWMKLIFLYSPEVMRETTSRRVISGIHHRFPAAPAIVDHYNIILHGFPAIGAHRRIVSENQNFVKSKF